MDTQVPPTHRRPFKEILAEVDRSLEAEDRNTGAETLEAQVSSNVPGGSTNITPSSLRRALGREDSQKDEPATANTGEVSTDPRTTNVAEDAINPAHYRKHPSGIECIEVTRHMNFNRGNALKYIWRADDKDDPITNIKKAIWYLEDEVRRLEARK